MHAPSKSMPFSLRPRASAPTHCRRKMVAVRVRVRVGVRVRVRGRVRAHPNPNPNLP